MALILDTSAVIGWVELKDPGVIDAIREHSAEGVRSDRGSAPPHDLPQ